MLMRVMGLPSAKARTRRSPAPLAALFTASGTAPVTTQKRWKSSNKGVALFCAAAPGANVATYRIARMAGRQIIAHHTTRTKTAPLTFRGRRLCIASGKNYACLFRRLRRIAAAPARPAPNSAMVTGSGTAVTAGVKLALSLVTLPPREALPPKLELLKLPVTVTLVKLKPMILALLVTPKKPVLSLTLRPNCEPPLALKLI